jgi:hypothetical protein
MGGGGSHYFSSDLDTLKEKLRASEGQTQNVKHETQVTGLLSAMLTEFNNRDHNAISAHLDEIKDALETDLEGTVDLLFGGSVAKHTYVDGLSDIDSLVILDSCELSDQSPQEAKEYFAQKLKERFPRAEIHEGNLAVTIRFNDSEIQLLPAVSCDDHVKIANRTGTDWSKIRPRRFTDALTRVNQEQGRKVIPVIKLAKAIIDTLPEKQKISGYHAESLAIEAFKAYQGSRELKPMLKSYFEQASSLVRQPIRDKTGQSVHVDDYLGPTNSLERRIVSDAFSRISRRMRNADNAASIDEWGKLFNE